MTKMHRMLTGAALALVIALPNAGHAVGTPMIVSPPGNTFYEFHPAVIERGDEVGYINLDTTGMHDVPSDQYGPDTANHCFKRTDERPSGAAGDIWWKPEQAKFYYVHKDNPSLTTLDPEMAALDANGDPIKARRFALGRCPMFFSELLYAGEAYPIEGLDNVVPGTIYTFKCSLHGNMRGRMVVLPARP